MKHLQEFVVRKALKEVLRDLTYIDLDSGEIHSECHHHWEHRDGCCGCCVVKELTEKLNEQVALSGC